MTDPTPAPLSREQMALLETLQQGRAHRATEAFRHQGERDHHKKVADALAAALAALRAQAPLIPAALAEHRRPMQDMGGVWHDAVAWEFIERFVAAPPPEAPEPPALVALVLEWQAAGKAVDEAGEGVTGEHWDRYCAAMDAVRYWTPAVSPVPPPATVEADDKHEALEAVNYVRRMLHWHTGPTAPAPYRGEHWRNEIDKLELALGILAPGQYPTLLDTEPTLLDTEPPPAAPQDAAPAPMPEIQAGDQLVMRRDDRSCYIADVAVPLFWARIQEEISAVVRNGVVIWRREGKP